MKKNTLKKIHTCASEGRIRFKKHALIRMVERNLKISEIEEALLRSKIIEDYPEDTPLKSCLLLGYTQHNRPLHMVTAVDEAENMIWIITVYKPDPKKWNRTFTKRKPS
jgi:hypothetical protein